VQYIGRPEPIFTLLRNQFHQAVQPGGPVRQPYSYSVRSPRRLFKHSSTGRMSEELRMKKVLDQKEEDQRHILRDRRPSTTTC
jgi:hypothetical protein